MSVQEFDTNSLDFDYDSLNLTENTPNGDCIMTLNGKGVFGNTYPYNGAMLSVPGYLKTRIEEEESVFKKNNVRIQFRFNIGLDTDTFYKCFVINNYCNCGKSKRLCKCYDQSHETAVVHSLYDDMNLEK